MKIEIYINELSSKLGSVTACFSKPMEELTEDETGLTLSCLLGLFSGIGENAGFNKEMLAHMAYKQIRAGKLMADAEANEIH
jgi:predicted house-cleaning noncanonical NTP pyrophosphatase (MazG superfamily)